MTIEKQFVDSITTLMQRDLNKLEEEIKSYPNNAALWKTDGDIKNAAGNLCLHLCGNLQYYIGAVLGNSGYIRNRDLEFSAKGLSQKELLAEIVRTKASVIQTLKTLTPETLIQAYPAPVFDYPMTTLHFLIHLEAHLTYHLGQINYHRRILGITAL